MLGLDLRPKALRQTLAEFFGTLALALVVVGSGLQGAALGGDSVASHLINVLATMAALWVLITAIGPLSGAHFNPAVTLMARVRGEISRTTVFAFMAAQVLGALVGVALANLMYLEQALTWSNNLRANPGTLLAELVATVGLLIVIGVLAARRDGSTPVGVALWIGAAALATSSTAFANPALSLARIVAADGSGIDPMSALGFVVVQLISVPIALIALRIFKTETDKRRRK